MDDTVSLKVNGRLYEGWTDVSIAASLQSLARSFSVSATRTATETGDLSVGIQCGDAVEVSIGQDRVLTGYVTDRDVSYDASSIKVTVKGRSKPVDLEECSLPERAPKRLAAQTHRANIAAVCGFFGISVVDEVKSKDKATFDAKVTETAKEALVRYLKAHSLILCDNEDGAVVISAAGSAGSAADELRVGKNVLSCERSQSFKARYSRVVAIGQSANALSEAPVANNQLSQGADDKTVKRERVKVIQLSGSATAAKLKARAQLVLNAGIGASDVCVYNVAGWRQSSGSLWRLNMFVSIVDPYTDLDEDFLITGVTFTMSATSGMRTRIECKPETAVLSINNQADKNTAKSSSSAKWTDVKKPSGTTPGGEWTKS